MPEDSPLTTPLVLTEPIEGDILLHDPPGETFVSAVVAPAQTSAIPDIAPMTGLEFTVTTLVAAFAPQLLVEVYDIVVVPVDKPVTTPEVLTVPTAGLVLLHAPPPAALVSAVLAPTHTIAVPVIVPASGRGLTVATCVAAAVPQLLFTVYDIVVVPADKPVTTPEVLTEPTAGLALLHSPPPAALVSDVLAPTHTIAVPAIVPASGIGLTVATCVAAAVPQLLLTVYDIVVVPAEKPVTTPEVLTEPTAGLVLLHAPPLVALVSEVLAPAHTIAVPVIVPASGRGLTVATCVAVAVPQLLLTV